MPAKIKLTTTLIIVESPAKCKKIEDILGPGYKCMATYGHIRELPSLKNIDIDNNFALKYEMIDNAVKRKNIEQLRQYIKYSKDIMIGSDADREGEAIAYSIIETFKLPLKTKRITFNEITEFAINEAVRNPRTIDMNLVYAQQSRQVLDLLVGFKISPVLWKLISGPKKDHALSAGRCQTPALKLIYENQKEIDTEHEQKKYNTIGYFTKLNLPYELDKHFEDENETIQFLEKSKDFSHIYNCSEPKKITKSPPEPFITSRIQQVASNELHYSPKETMRICQQLYEKGYITYMRTDCKEYSKEFTDVAREYIKKEFGEEYNRLSSDKKQSERKTKAKKSFAQEAHEAIRPTNISLKELVEEEDAKERKLYKLIWTNTMESLMSDATFYTIISSISAPDNLKYTYSSELIDFPGWKIVENKFSRTSEEYQYLQTVKKGSIIRCKKIYSKFTIGGIKHHYTEAMLVKLLEDKGIGRPSTFSSIVDKIQERGYVKKEDIKGKSVVCTDFELEDGKITQVETIREFGNEKSKLVIQPLGTIVMEFLDKHFNKLFNYEYTSLMETALDKIAKNELIWFELCGSCNKEVDELIEQVRDETKFEVQIDDNNTYLIGKFGPVIKCVEEVDGKEEITFKQVKKDVDVSKVLEAGGSIYDIVDTDRNVSNSQYNLGEYKGSTLTIKKGKFGLYASWGSESRTLKELGNRPIENITREEVVVILDKGPTLIREINSHTSIRKGPKGDYIFHKDTKMKKPNFYDIKGFTEDYKTCDIVILKSWITATHGIKF